jgi:hypothetical protein
LELRDNGFCGYNIDHVLHDEGADQSHDSLVIDGEHRGVIVRYILGREVLLPSVCDEHAVTDSEGCTGIGEQVGGVVAEEGVGVGGEGEGIHVEGTSGAFECGFEITEGTDYGVTDVEGFEDGDTGGAEA